MLTGGGEDGDGADANDALGDAADSSSDVVDAISDSLDAEGEDEPPTHSAFSAEEISDMRFAFSWEDTEELPEADTLGRPTVYYTLLLIHDREQLHVLDEVGIYWDPMPLFEQELDYWDSLPEGTLIQFEADTRGTYVFAMLPDEVYNDMRAVGLADPNDEFFESVILWDAPPMFRMDSDWLDLDRLYEEGLELPSIPEETSNVAEVSERLAPARLLRGFRRFLRGWRAVGRGIRSIAHAVQPKRDYRVRLVVRELSEGFRSESPQYRTAAVRGWSIAGDPIGWGGQLTEGVGGCWFGAGECPLVPHGAKMAFVAGLVPRSTAKIGRDGWATARVVKREWVRVYVQTKNDAVFMSRHGLLDNRIKISDRKRSRGDVTLELCTDHEQLYAMSVLTDAQDFSDEVLDFKPPRVNVHTGFGGVDGSFVMALSLHNFPAVGGVGLLLNHIAWIIDGDIDMHLAKADRQDRVIAYHEYGHWVMATAINAVSPSGFQILWELALANAGGTNVGEFERTNVEAFADVFASQATGGVNYFKLFRRTGADTGERTGWIKVSKDGDDLACLDVGTSQLEPCLEDNLGQAQTTSPRFPDPIADLDFEDALGREVAQLVTEMVDGVDGSSPYAGLGSGNYWAKCSDPNAADCGLRFQIGPDYGDESVSITGEDVISAVEDFGRAYRLSAPSSERESISTHFARQARSTHSGSDVCMMVALHRESGLCNVPLRATSCPYQGTATNSVLIDPCSEAFETDQELFGAPLSSPLELSTGFWRTSTPEGFHLLIAWESTLERIDSIIIELETDGQSG